MQCDVGWSVINCVGFESEVDGPLEGRIGRSA